MAYTPDHIYWSHELKSCEDDFDHLAKTYLRFKSKKVIGFPTLRFNKVQQHIDACVKDQWRRTGKIRQIWGKSRQVGSSTYWRAHSFHRTAFRSHVNALLVAHSEPDAMELFQLDTGFYDALPSQLRPDLKYRSKSKMEFVNRNSKLLVNHAQNMHVGASQMNHLVHLTEVARYPNAHEIQASLFPSISNAVGKDCSVVVIESTSKFGGLWFKQFAEEAMKGNNEYEFHFVPWYKHEDYHLPVPKGFEPTAEERDLLRRYPELTWSNLAWYRNERSKFATNIIVFQQEYPFCLAQGTRVSTQRGLIPIEQALSGDVTESGEILEQLNNGTRETLEVTTALGYRVRCTPDHRIQLASGEWEQAQFLQDKTIRLLPPRFAETYYIHTWKDIETSSTSVLIDDNWGRFLGYFMGDGSLYFKQGTQHPLHSRAELDICCTRRDQDVVEDVSKLWSTLFNTTPERRIHDATESAGGESVRHASYLYGPLFYRLGLIHRSETSGRWKRHVHVPDIIWRSPRSVVREFLRGLFESDGCVWKSSAVMLASKYEDFLRDVQLLLLGFGITSRLGKWTAKGGSYVLQCRQEESRLFHERVGFVSQRKTERASKIRCKLGRPKFPVVLEDRVIAITPADPIAVYDLNLPAPHVFSANGIAVHNCWEESWIMPVGTMRTFQEEVIGYIDGCLKAGTRYVVGSRGLEENIAGEVEVWELPQEGVFYDIGVDVAGGATADADWTVLEVIRRDTLAQVAEVRVHMDPAGEQFFDLTYWLGRAYHSAQMVPDITGGWGHALLSDLQKRNYPNIWQWRRRDDLNEKVSTRLGFYYTKRDKSWLVHNAVKTLQREKPLVHSPKLLSELRGFLTIGLDEWGAAPGQHDDMTNAYMLALLGAVDERPSAHAEPVTPAATRITKPWSMHDIQSDLDGGKSSALGSYIDRVMAVQ